MKYNLINSSVVSNETIRNYINNNIKDIIDFLNISHQTINIEILEYKEFKKKFEEYLNTSLKKYCTGFIMDNANTVCILSFADCQYTNHKDDNLEQFLKVIIHELCHLFHSISCNKNYPEDKYYEGLAYYFAKQRNSPYYEFFAELLNNNSYEEVLRILNVNKKEKSK